jgi:predicted glycosyltransferase
MPFFWEPRPVWHWDCPDPVVRHEFDPGPFSPLPPRGPVASHRFLFYSHDSYGLGHLRRSLTLATGLVETVPDAEVLVITGSPCATLFPTPPRIGLVKIPSVSKTAGGDYVPRSLSGTLEETLALRRSLILEAYRSFQPTLIVVDHKVIGLHGEAYEMLREAARDGVHSILGIRDIIDSPGAVAVEWGGEKCRWALSEGFERVCVYGSPDVFDTRLEYPVPPELVERVEFTGYVVRPAHQPRPHRTPRTRPQVLVTMGGGQDGTEQLGTYLAGLERERPDWDSVLVGGPLLGEREARRMRRRAELLGNVQLRRFHADLPALLEDCDAVVAMAGYNTSAEILQSGKPSVLLPRTHPRMEQAIRAERFQRRHLTRCLIDPDPRELVQGVARALEAGPPRPENLPPLDGVANFCAMARELLVEPKRQLTVRPTRKAIGS